jgi:hypothetical protein
MSFSLHEFEKISGRKFLNNYDFGNFANSTDSAGKLNTKDELSMLDSDYRTIFGPQMEYLDSLFDRETPSVMKIYNGIKYYIEGDYKTLNQKLCGSYIGKNKELNSDEQNCVNALNKIFNEIPPLQEPVIVYRGIKTELQENFLNCQYVSTSLNKRVAIARFSNFFSCCILEITIPKGTRVIPIMEYSEWNDEFEVILNRGGRYEIINIDTIIKPNSYNIVYILPNK